MTIARRCMEEMGDWSKVLEVINSENAETAAGGGAMGEPSDERLFLREEGWDGPKYLRCFSGLFAIYTFLRLTTAKQEPTCLNHCTSAHKNSSIHIFLVIVCSLQPGERQEFIPWCMLQQLMRKGCRRCRQQRLWSIGQGTHRGSTYSYASMHAGPL
jgi:hypothetical protein